DLAAHADLLAIARDDARLALTRDPGLDSPRGQALRTLLYLFQRDVAVRYLLIRARRMREAPVGRRDDAARYHHLDRLLDGHRKHDEVAPRHEDEIAG